VIFLVSSGHHDGSSTGEPNAFASADADLCLFDEVRRESGEKEARTVFEVLTCFHLRAVNRLQDLPSGAGAAARVVAAGRRVAVVDVGVRIGLRSANV